MAQDNIEDYLLQHEERVWAVFFRDFKDLFYHSEDPWLTAISDRDEIAAWLAERRNTIEEKYRIFSKNDIRDELLKYQIHYILWDKKDGTLGNPRQYPFLKKVFDENDIEIYSVE